MRPLSVFRTQKLTLRISDTKAGLRCARIDCSTAFLQAETHREYCERVLAQGRSTSSALLADLRYMQEQVGAGVAQEKQQVLLPGPGTLDVISEEEQDEFRQYLQKAGIR